MTSFSVFLPVRNGWPYIESCVDSILSQAHAGVELHILDNCSTDATASWLRSLRNPRIQVSWSGEDLSIEQSWIRILKCQKGEYMTVIGHDDLLDRYFFSAIEALIEQYPAATLYQTGARYINSAGKTIRNCRTVSRQETAAEYLRERFQFRKDVFGTGYVMRSKDFDRVGGIPPFERLLFADDALWISLMRGSFKAADSRQLCSVRIHNQSASASNPSLWHSLLKGLNQFDGFLRSEVAADVALADVVKRYCDDFMLGYHRNVYVYAMLHACESMQPPDAAAGEIMQSLSKLAPTVATSLKSSPTVLAIELLMRIGMHRQVLWLWERYSRFRTGAG